MSPCPPLAAASSGGSGSSAAPSALAPCASRAAHHVPATLACGEQQRRGAASIRAPRLRSGCEKRFGITRRAADHRDAEHGQSLARRRVSVRTAHQHGAQQLRGGPCGGHREVGPARIQVARGSLHAGRRRGLLDRVVRQRRCAPRAQHRRHLGRPALGGEVERGPPFGIARRHAGTGREQALDCLGALAQCGVHECRIAAAIGDCDVGTGREQRLDRRSLSAPRRKHERRHAVLIRRVYGGAALDQQRDRGCRARLRGARQRSAAKLIAHAGQGRVREQIESWQIAIGRGQPERFTAHGGIGELRGRQQARGQRLVRTRRLRRRREPERARARQPARGALAVRRFGIAAQRGEAEGGTRMTLRGRFFQPRARRHPVGRATETVQVEGTQEILRLGIPGGGDALQRGGRGREVLEPDRTLHRLERIRRPRDCERGARAQQAQQQRRALRPCHAWSRPECRPARGNPRAAHRRRSR